VRHPHCRLRATLVTTTLVTHLVASLHLRPYKRSVPARLLAQLLLLAAATGRSLSALAQRCDAAPSDEAVRLALRFNLPPDSLAVLDHLLEALHQLVPPPFRRGRPVGAALDLHLRPYYGAADTAGTCGGQREAGTDRFWGYGTLVLLHRGLRLTVGLCPVDRRQSLVAVVRTLVEQAQSRGVRLRWLLLDRGFYDAQVIHYLQQQHLPFVMPMIRRGDPARGSGTQRFFQGPAGWYDYSWTARPRVREAATGRKRSQAALTVRVRVLVVPRPAKKAWVYVCWGVAWDAALVVKRYRRRFGIETSYRQLGECLARTTSKDARVRLLLVGLALLVRQYWAWAHYVVLAEVAGNGHRRLRPHLLRLADVLLWLLIRLAKRLRFRLEIDNLTPIAPGV
jgi:hypothetical protein